MPVYQDQMNRSVEVLSTPKRIISLVPSQTELLFDLGLYNEIIGITKFCIHPFDKVKLKSKIGGTKALNINLIKELMPDLIIGNKEENERSQVEELMELFPVWMSNIADLDGATEMIKRVGELIGKNTEAEKLIRSVRFGFDALNIKSKGLRVAYLIWRKPYITAARGTFIDDMLQKCGFTNVFDAARYPEVTAEQLISVKPELVLLSSEPYPFKEKHIAEFKAILPESIIKLVDGELFSWYGSRLLHAPSYFEKLQNELQSLKSQK
ncbi:MAG: transporter substrate-binding protein [Mucilaginibacter sp.]|nr:transporter substrate-binding protein [Mucilaginibacter sp.]